MSDPFAKWRRRQADRAPGKPSAPMPIAEYKALYLNRGWSLALVLVWTPLVLGLIVLMFLYERELNDVPYGTGIRVLVMLLLVASLAVAPLLGPTTRRRWTLWADRLDISQRPFVPLIGRYRNVRLAFGDIAVARMGEVLAGMALFELEARDGRRFRLLPTTIGEGRDARIDQAGLHAFVDTIRATISASGAPVPPGEELLTVTSGLTGVVILGVVTALFAAGALAGAGVLLTGEPIGLQIIAFTAPFGLLFGGLLAARWRKWQARRLANRP